MFSFNTLIERARRLVLYKLEVHWHPRYFTVEIKSASPLQVTPEFKKLVRRVTFSYDFLNLSVDVSHIS